MIQLITNSEYLVDNTKIKKSSLKSFEDLNSYEINIIDLANSNIWEYHNDSLNNVDCYSDLSSLKEALKESIRKTVIILPQNITFKYDYGYKELSRTSYTNTFRKEKLVKDIIPDVIKILKKDLIDMQNIGIQYGKTSSILIDKELYADFSLTNCTEKEKIIIAKNKTSVTAIKKENVAITTLKIENEEDIIRSLKCIFPECFEIESNEPEWINDIDF